MRQIGQLYFDFHYWWLSLPALLRGAGITIWLAVAVTVTGVAGGLLLAALRALHLKPLSLLIVAFVDIFRAIPVIVLLFLMFFAMPYAGIRINGPGCAIVALGLNLAAVSEEAFWAGIRAVPEGQWQAGRSLGLSELVLLGLIILPQAIRLAVPLVTSKVISSTKDTALASVVAVPELLNQMSTEQGNYANPSPLMFGALIYLVMFVPLVVLSRRVEHRQLQRTR